MDIVGRKKEKKLLSDCLAAQEPRFVAVYGRRRVGKTFLVREQFQNRFAFYVMGSAEGSLSTQLQIFRRALEKYFVGFLPPG